MTRMSAAAPQRPLGEFDLRGRRLWPTMIFTRQWQDYAAHADALVEHLLDLQSRENENIASGVAVGSKSEEGLFESKMDLFERAQHPALKALIAFIDETMRQSIALANEKRAHPDKIDVDYIDSWFHVTNDGGFHDAHYHGGCSWCGIFYVRAGDVPEKKPAHAPNGVNRFYAPYVVGGMHEDFGSSYLRHNLIDIPPRDGQVCVFPAFMQHSALPYKGSVDRIVIAFNTTSSLVRS